MLHTAATRLGTVAVQLLGVLGVPAPAEADTRSFSDPTGDIRAGIDVVRVTVRNEARVVVTVRHQDLRRSEVGGSGVYLDTASHRGPAFLFGAGVGEATDWNMWRARSWTSMGRLPPAKWRRAHSSAA